MLDGIDLREERLPHVDLDDLKVLTIREMKQQSKALDRNLMKEISGFVANQQLFLLLLVLSLLDTDALEEGVNFKLMIIIRKI